MKSISRSPIARFLAIFSLVLQVAVPSAYAATGTGANNALFICAFGGPLSAEARAAAEAFAELLGEPVEEQERYDACLLCIFGCQTVGCVAPSPSFETVVYPFQQVFLVVHDRTVFVPVDIAPLGPRAPPSHI